MNCYILNNRIAGILEKEIKKAIPTERIKKVLGSDGIWCRIVFQSGGTGATPGANQHHGLQSGELAGRVWTDTRSKKGTSGFEITMDFVIYPGETVSLPRIWETNYEEIINTRKKEVWDTLNLCNKWLLKPGCAIKVKGQLATYIGEHTNPYLNRTSAGDVLGKDIQILVSV